MSVYKGVAYSRLVVHNLEVDQAEVGVVLNKGYTVATVPDASGLEGATIYVSDGAEGDPVIAFSDGTNWLRCDTRAAISVD